MKSMIANLRGMLASRRAPLYPRSAGFIFTKDAAEAYQFRMRAGFAGSVNRFHPAQIEPVSIDAANPPLLFGVPGVIDAGTHLFRKILAADQALLDVYGITVRPFPAQGLTAPSMGIASPAFGGEGPNGIAKLDVLRQGYIMVLVNNFAAAQPVKGGKVYIWTAATAGAHIQGGWEAVDPAGSGMQLPWPSCTFQGGTDGSGATEIVFHR